MTVRDPIHGAIEFQDAEKIEGGSVIAAVDAPMTHRLRQIKQNPFASYAFLGADHTRYAHAVGTMQTVRKLLLRLNRMRSGCFAEASIEKIAKLFPDAFSNDSLIARQEDLCKHLVFAGLLQDVGELPYQFVTKQFFRLKRENRERVSDHIGLDLSLVREKDALTLATIFAEENKSAVSALDQTLLAYLISGPSIENPDDPKLHALAPFLRMLEGEVDGDRLDYVFRDAYHTIGTNGSPDAVIATLLDYDLKGPVLSDPGPVTAFFTLRASLWQQVFFHPRVRFRIALLFEVLKGIHEQLEPEVRNKRAYETMKDRKLSFHLTPKEFGEFTDHKLWEILTLIHGDSKARGSLNGRAERALALLLEQYDLYESVWLPKPDEFREGTTPRVTVPVNLFWDAFGTLMEHQLYSPGSVRVAGPEWACFDGSSKALEDCGGPFSDVFKSGGHTQPLPGAIQLFRPPESERRGAAWASVKKTLPTGALYKALKSLADENRVGALSDTWERSGFTGPRICISFATIDLRYVEHIVSILHDRKKRYRLLRENDGIGSSAERNSRDLVAQSEAAVIVLSEGYAAAYRDAVGNVHAEVEEMIIRYRNSAKYAVGFVALDAWPNLKGALPYKDLVGIIDPFLGTGLRGVQALTEFEQRLNEVWAKLEENSES